MPSDDGPRLQCRPGRRRRGLGRRSCAAPPAPASGADDQDEGEDEPQKHSEVQRVEPPDAPPPHGRQPSPRKGPMGEKCSLSERYPGSCDLTVPEVGPVWVGRQSRVGRAEPHDAGTERRNARP